MPDQSEVRIYDVLGEIQTPCNFKHSSLVRREIIKIDVSGLAPGMYFVRIGDKVGKFVKEKI